jgi:hypothetical protein
VFLTADVLRRDLHEMYGVGRRVAVAGPGALAAEVALFLAGWGRRPTVIVPGGDDAPFPDAHPTHAARLKERLAGYKVPLVTGATPLEWRYDPGRRSQLRVRRPGGEEVLGPFHTAIAAAGWPLKAEVSGRRSPVSGQASQASEASSRERGVWSPTELGPRLRPTGAGAAGDPATGEDVTWPLAVYTPPVPDAVPDGTTVVLGDTPYPEPLRDLVAYAHLLARLL